MDESTPLPERTMRLPFTLLFCSSTSMYLLQITSVDYNYTLAPAVSYPSILHLSGIPSKYASVLVLERD